jgi:hypothetical protein
MERRRKTGTRVTISRLDPTEYDASPFAISMYPISMRSPTTVRSSSVTWNQWAP